MNPAEIFDVRTSFNLWLAFLVGLGGLIVGGMCLWKLYKLTSGWAKSEEVWKQRYDTLARHDEKIVDELYRLRKGMPASEWLELGKMND